MTDVIAASFINLFEAEVKKLEAELAKTDPGREEAVKILEACRFLYGKMSSSTEKAIEDHAKKNEQDKVLALGNKQLACFNSMTEIEKMMASTFPVKVDPVASAAVHRVNLPQRKLGEFTGNVREWLGFWSSFEDIHGDSSIPEADKFQYLLQCIPKTSPARKCIDGFAIAAKNYDAAVTTLKNLYGRTNMLTKVYVRDLLDLVTKNAMEGDKTDFIDLFPKLSSHIRNLEQLGVTTDKCENILYPVVESCIPDDILQVWQRHADYEEKLDKLMEFLNTEVTNKMDRSMAKMQFTSGETTKKNQKKVVEAEVPTAAGFFAGNAGPKGKDKKNNEKSSCAFCDSIGHRGQKCPEARSWTISKKMGKLKEKKRCFNCLQPGHSARDCPTMIVCRLCGGNHFDIMCTGGVRGGNPTTMMAIPQGIQQPLYSQQQYIPISQQQDEIRIDQMTPNAPVNGTIQQQVVPSFYQPQTAAQSGPQHIRTKSTKRYSNLVNRRNRKIVLMTVAAIMETEKGSFSVRIFIDPGSMESFIEKWCADACGFIPVGKQEMQHQVFGGHTTRVIQHTEVSVNLRSMSGQTKSTFILNTIEKIASGIEKPEPGPWIDVLEEEGIVLPDQEGMNEDVHILLGMDVYARLFTGRVFRVNEDFLAKETIFGWVVGGILPPPQMKITRSNMVTTAIRNNCSIDELWSLETLGITEDSSTQTKRDLEDATVEHFKKTLQRKEDGRYVASLPFKSGYTKLGGNFNQAFSRLKKVTEDLHRQGYWTAYDQVFREWEDMGVVEEASEDEVKRMHDLYVLPHRHVIKENSSTTPVRPVFDASAKGKGGKSLNEVLEKGPNLLELIPSVVCGFRKEEVGAISDVKKAFLMIEVRKEDQQVLYFLWWKDESCTELKLYRHVRVIFGAKPSPFILLATLKHHVELYCVDDDLKMKLLKSLYVDNSCSSHPSMEVAKKFQEKSQGLLLPAHFDLRGWEFSGCEEAKMIGVLGMMWEPKSDTMSLCLDSPQKRMQAPLTKRGLLSLVNSVFDPMGFVCAFTIRPKMWLQECARLKLDWDTPLPEDLAVKVENWKSQVTALEKLKIPRWLNLDDSNEGVTLHCFTDASGSAFAAYVFVRKEMAEDVKVQLVMGKSRVAPLKNKVTIPRLELLGFEVGSLLTVNCVVKYLELENVPVHYWTDSSTALAWITQDKEWARFVENRVQVVRRLTTTDQWHHIAGELNPADIPSRGCSAKKLVESRFWEGPEWLRQPESEWPRSSVEPRAEDVDAERRKSVVSAAVIKKNEVLAYLLHYASYNRMLLVVGLVNRLLKTVRSGQSLRGSMVAPLSVEEMDDAEKVIVRCIQRQCFSGISDSRLDGMGAFVDEDGIIRMKSQLLHAREDFGMRCPMILPHEHPIVSRIIRREHFRHCHQGPKYLQGVLREKFWILRSYRTISTVVYGCSICKRFNARRCEVPTPALPLDRVRDTAAFCVTGVDLAGPLTLKGGDKVWIVLFTCAVYRAVHLELVSTLSTQGFVMALQRFVARRGRPTTMYSDNGLNFVGCANSFRKIDWAKVEKYATLDRIQWKFNPPTAAWWGGWWERLVGLTKKILRRVLGNKSVNYEELSTILCEAEACLNQRPLTYMSDRKDELLPLTPAYFLRDNVQSFLPEVELLDGGSLNARAKLCAKIKRDLRVRFRKEYLGQLRHRGGKRTRTVKVGDAVIIEDDNKKRLEWNHGVVAEVYPGEDGIVRMVLVKTKDGSLLRAVQRLFLMEAASEDDQSSEDQVGEEKGEDPADQTGGQVVESHASEGSQPVQGMKNDHKVEEDIVITRAGRKVVKPDRFM